MSAAISTRSGATCTTCTATSDEEAAGRRWARSLVYTMTVTVATFQGSHVISISIIKVDIPYVVRAGSPDPVVLDCNYDLGNSKTQGLVIKWFVNQDVLYQWIHGKNPAGSDEFQKYIDASYRASNDTRSEYRAVKLVRPGHELSGNIKCIISTIFDEVEAVRKMLVYSPEKVLRIHQPMMNETTNRLIVSCSAEDLFPKPRIIIYWNRTTFPCAATHRFEINIAKFFYYRGTAFWLENYHASRSELKVTFADVRLKIGQMRFINDRYSSAQSQWTWLKVRIRVFASVRLAKTWLYSSVVVAASSRRQTKLQHGRDRKRITFHTPTALLSELLKARAGAAAANKTLKGVKGKIVGVRRARIPADRAIIIASVYGSEPTHTFDFVSSQPGGAAQQQFFVVFVRERAPLAIISCLGVDPKYVKGRISPSRRKSRGAFVSLVSESEIVNYRCSRISEYKSKLPVKRRETVKERVDKLAGSNKVRLALSTGSDFYTRRRHYIHRNDRFDRKNDAKIFHGGSSQLTIVDTQATSRPRNGTYQYKYEVDDKTDNNYSKIESRDDGEDTRDRYFVKSKQASTDVNYIVDKQGYQSLVKHDASDEPSSLSAGLLAVGKAIDDFNGKEKTKSVQIIQTQDASRQQKQQQQQQQLNVAEKNIDRELDSNRTSRSKISLHRAKLNTANSLNVNYVTLPPDQRIVEAIPASNKEISDEQKQYESPPSIKESDFEVAASSLVVVGNGDDENYANDDDEDDSSVSGTNNEDQLIVENSGSFGQRLGGGQSDDDNDDTAAYATTVSTTSRTILPIRNSQQQSLTYSSSTSRDKQYSARPKLLKTYLRGTKPGLGLVYSSSPAPAQGVTGNSIEFEASGAEHRARSGVLVSSGSQAYSSSENTVSGSVYVTTPNPLLINYASQGVLSTVSRITTLPSFQKKTEYVFAKPIVVPDTAAKPSKEIPFQYSTTFKCEDDVVYSSTPDPLASIKNQFADTTASQILNSIQAGVSLVNSGESNHVIGNTERPAPVIEEVDDTPQAEQTSIHLLNSIGPQDGNYVSINPSFGSVVKSQVNPDVQIQKSVEVYQSLPAAKVGTKLVERHPDMTQILKTDQQKPLYPPSNDLSLKQTIHTRSDTVSNSNLGSNQPVYIVPPATYIIEPLPPQKSNPYKFAPNPVNTPINSNIYSMKKYVDQKVHKLSQYPTSLYKPIPIPLDKGVDRKVPTAVHITSYQIPKHEKAAEQSPVYGVKYGVSYQQIMKPQNPGLFSPYMNKLITGINVNQNNSKPFNGYAFNEATPSFVGDKLRIDNSGYLNTVTGKKQQQISYASRNYPISNSLLIRRHAAVNRPSKPERDDYAGPVPPFYHAQRQFGFQSKLFPGTAPARKARNQEPTSIANEISSSSSGDDDDRRGRRWWRRRRTKNTTHREAWYNARELCATPHCEILCTCKYIQADDLRIPYVWSGPCALCIPGVVGAQRSDYRVHRSANNQYFPTCGLSHARPRRSLSALSGGEAERGRPTGAIVSYA
ncbi:unnamed protein product, partial [Trichogramma brassicae]